MSGLELTASQREVLAFQDNLCVLAGAGSGKTLTLVELVLKLLAEGLDLSRILALTYTEKAAREMRDRVRLALNERINQAREKERGFWVRQRRLLDRATISTIHSFCLQILRQYGLEAGVDPGFKIIEEDRDFLSDARRDILLDRLQKKDQDLLDLIDWFPWISQGRRQGLDRLTSDIAQYSRTYGREVRIGEGETGSIAPILDDLNKAAGLVFDLAEAGKLNMEKAYAQKAMAFAEKVREITGTSQGEEEMLPDLAGLGDYLAGGWFAAKPARDLAVKALEEIQAEIDRRLSQPIKEKLKTLAKTMDRAVSEAKERRGILDFDDLLLETRRLLAEKPDVRRSLKERYPIILVDEFQDTNRLQADILAYLAEPEGDEAAYPADTPAAEILARASKRLVIFGDPKQSIYRFRGAEVSVFQRFRWSMEEEAVGRGVIPLNKNFRSKRQLIDLYNEFFQRMMPGREDYAASYEQADYQYYHRRSSSPGPAALILNTPSGSSQAEERKLEAQALAKYIQEILSDGKGVRVGEDGRIPQEKDVAVLLRRFTHLKEYERTFQEAGLDYYTVRGRGFYQCTEVWDLINLLFYLTDFNDGPSLLGVLRSPLVGLSDDQITRLAWAGSNRPDLLAFFGPNPKPFPPDPEFAEAARASKWLAELIAMAGVAFPAEIVERAVEDRDYLAVLAAQPQGEQKAANVQRFIETSRNLPYEALYSPHELAGFLRARLMDTQDDPEAQVSREEEDSIQIMTIHQAKGLEFPVVLVPDAGASPRLNAGRILFGDDDLLAISFKDPDTGKTRKPGDYLRLNAEHRQREMAEHVRLLYVAATRAEDHLVFSGSLESMKKDSWLVSLAEFQSERPDLLGLEEPVESGISEPELSLPEADLTENLPEPGPEAGRIVRRVFDRPQVQARTVTVNVTGLAQYLTCPRRYYLENVLGLTDNGTGGAGEGPSQDPRIKGTVFHYLMETVDLGAPFDLEMQTRYARQRAAEEGLDLDPSASEDLAGRVLEFLESPWGKDLLKAQAAKRLVRRESNIWLRIEPSLILTGEMDLFYVRPDGLARVIDYKYSAVKETGRYESQLKTYALALVKAGLSGRLEAGLYYSIPGGSGELLEIPLKDNWMEEWESVLSRAAQDLIQITSPEAEAPLPITPCPDPTCGLSYTCRKEALPHSI